MKKDRKQFPHSKSNEYLKILICRSQKFYLFYLNELYKF